MPEQAQRVSVGGIGFDPVDEEEALRMILDAAVGGVGGRVVTPNMDFLRQAADSPGQRQLLDSADLVLADGQPIVWASRLLGTPLPSRVPGSALGPSLAAEAVRRGVGIYLLGGAAGSAERAATLLSERHAGLRVGWHFPPFGFLARTDQVAEVEAALERFGPCVCLVGLGFPKQDELGRRLLRSFPATWFIGVGATIDFIAGEFSRAPRWAQSLGIEWVYRLAQEPSRLAGRYLRAIPFTASLLISAAKRGRSTRAEV